MGITINSFLRVSCKDYITYYLYMLSMWLAQWDCSYILLLAVTGHSHNNSPNVPHFNMPLNIYTCHLLSLEYTSLLGDSLWSQRLSWLRLKACLDCPSHPSRVSHHHLCSWGPIRVHCILLYLSLSTYQPDYELFLCRLWITNCIPRAQNSAKQRESIQYLFA